MNKPLPNIWRWPGLTGAVLLLHLCALDALPVSLSPRPADAPTKLHFAIRNGTPLAAPDAPRAKTIPPKPQPARIAAQRPATKPKPKPADETPAPSSTVRELPSTATPTPATAATQVTATAPVAAASHVSVVAAESADSVPAQYPQSVEMGAHWPTERLLLVKGDALRDSTRLIYQVRASRFPYRLSGELLWRNEGGSYQALLRYSALGLTRVQTSRGRITGQGLAPERFSDKYRSEVAAHFNYPQAKVTFSANTPDAPLLVGAQDRLSVLIQLGALLASNPKQVGNNSILSVQTVGARAADIWIFTVFATEPLSLPGGDMQAIKLERLPREPYDQKVEVWLAPQLGYLPARIRITEANGESIDQLWQATEPVDADTSVPKAAVPATGH